MADSFKNLKIAAVATVTLAVIVLMGLALVNQYSFALRISTTGAQRNVTLSNNTAVNIGTAATTPFLRSVQACQNSTLVVGAANYTIALGNENTAGTITLDEKTAEWNAQTVNCSVTYLADSSIEPAADAFGTGLAIFGTFMGVLVLAIMGLAIIKLFRKGKD